MPPPLSPELFFAPSALETLVLRGLGAKNSEATSALLATTGGAYRWVILGAS